MTSFTFTPATREAAKARIALAGPSGSGKTFTALAMATAMGSSVALIDTERGSASKYARGTTGDGFEFSTLQMYSFDPRDLPKALAAAAAEKFQVLIVDSLSHFWSGTGGMLEQVDQAAKRTGGGNSFAGWKQARPYERAMIDALVSYPGHVIVTMRTKTEYVVEPDERGRKVPRKVGLKPEQRDGIEYEFDIVGDLDHENTLIVSKSRCQALSGAVIHKPGEEVATTVLQWLGDGEPVPDAADLLDAACDPQLTIEDARFLHKQASKHQLLGAAVLHPTTGVPTTLRDYIEERGKALRTGQSPAGQPPTEQPPAETAA